MGRGVARPRGTIRVGLSGWTDAPWRGVFHPHGLRVGDFAPALRNFLASGLLRLGPRLGPLLWQFPPNFHFAAARTDVFPGALPHDTEHAGRMARAHDAALGAWAGRVRAWAAGGTPAEDLLAPKAPRRPRDVFVYFDNDAKVRAPRDAMGLMGRPGIAAGPPGPEARPAPGSNPGQEESPAALTPVARLSGSPLAS